MLAWGLGASVCGLLGATNFRGFADKYAPGGSFIGETAAAAALDRAAATR
jgi:hypothetical protein